jgi:hypothetical protein
VSTQNTEPVFHHPEMLQQLKFRDWLRKLFPPPSKGGVVEDLDLLLEGFGPCFKTDKVGRYALLELKFGRSWPNYAQQVLFGDIHRRLRESDPNRLHYMGYFLVQYTNDDWYQAQFRVFRAKDKTPLLTLEPLDDHGPKSPEELLMFLKDVLGYEIIKSLPK